LDSSYSWRLRWFGIRSRTVLRFAFLSCLISAIAAVASGQALPDSPLAAEALVERYQDPPMFIWRTDVSEGRISQQGPFTSYQVNVDGNGQNIVGDAANEPSIAVDPTDRNKMVIGWRQFNSVSSNFRQAGWGFTNNGGVSWTFPGVLENGVFRSDPVLAANDIGHFFYLSLLSNFFDNMWRSLDSGQSWTNLGPATGGDKQWFTIDNTNSTGHGFQYQCWSAANGASNYGGRQFSRSIDGGTTWMDPIFLPNSPSWGTPDVDADGNLFIGGLNFSTSRIWSLRSSNARNGSVSPTFDRITQVNLGGDVSGGAPINPEGLIGQIFVAADRSGGATNNNVYMLASVVPFSASTGSHVMFVRSTDSGTTYSAPRRINDDPINPNKWHWFGTLAVAPNGRLDAVWLDTRNAANNTDSQLFYSYSIDGGTTWSTNVAVSEPFNPFVGYPNQNKLGDYLTIVSDIAGGNVAYSATFNGEEDIYYVRVAPPALQLLNISTRTRVSTGEKVLIAGFIITGSQPKRVIIRGIGPSLSGFAGVLPDPTLELHQGNTTLVTNDNWKTRQDGSSQQAEVEATGLAPANDLESAIVGTLAPGSYTAILSGKNGATGIGVVEVYDLDQAANSELANISSRGFVDINNDVMIGGLIVGGANTDGKATVLVRALGPSLTGSGVQDVLPDPVLELHDSNGATLTTNDNWKINDQTQQSQESAIRATAIAPTNDLEGALVVTLSPGAYTAIVRGKNNTVGVGLVEVYNLK
jgi:hypothetical protein